MKRLQEVTINWHITEACNFGCGYCYAKWSIKRTPFRDIYPDVLRLIAAQAGSCIEVFPEPIVAERIRLNFAGGEPFLMKTHLEQAIVLADELGLSPSFISNGVLVEDKFIAQFGPLISVAGFSFDSFQPEMMARIGRTGPRGEQLTAERLGQIFDLFRQVSPSTVLKLNTVVCAENADEDLREGLRRLAPDRWKMLRVIPGHGGTPISDEQFSSFVDRHAGVPHSVAEDNSDMHRSYLMMNPQGRFYQRDGSGYLYGPDILSTGAAAALRGVEFDPDTYMKRY